MPVTYPITDLGCAAYLVAIGHKLQGIAPSKFPHRFYFLFSGSEKLTADELAYFQDATIVARNYMNALKLCKSMLYNAFDEPNRYNNERKA